jgi:hypothetical protein
VIALRIHALHQKTMFAMSSWLLSASCKQQRCTACCVQPAGHRIWLAELGWPLTVAVQPMSLRRYILKYILEVLTHTYVQVLSQCCNASTNSGLLLKVVLRLTLCDVWIVAAGLAVQTMSATQPLCPVKVSGPLLVSD